MKLPKLLLIFSQLSLIMHHQWGIFIVFMQSFIYVYTSSSFAITSTSAGLILTDASSFSLFFKACTWIGLLNQKNDNQVIWKNGIFNTCEWCNIVKEKQINQIRNVWTTLVVEHSCLQQHLLQWMPSPKQIIKNK